MEQTVLVELLLLTFPQLRFCLFDPIQHTGLVDSGTATTTTSCRWPGTCRTVVDQRRRSQHRGRERRA
uniref:Putative secreted protein n=1 Tax=Anopheles marajoara TaxID=58244 RepID=A0A2M4CFA0_9DIPT